MYKLRNLTRAGNIRPWRRVRGAIGADFSLSYLHMVQLVRNADGRIEVAGRASVPHTCERDALLRSPDLLKKQVAQAIREGRFTGRKAVLAMPPSQFRTMSVNYRTPKGVSDDQTILSLMKERLDGPITDYVIDYIPVSTQARDAEKLAIVAVSPRKAVLSFLDAIRTTGLRAEALEIGPVAICRLVGAIPDAGSQMTLVITSGQSQSYLTLLAGRRLLMDQAVEFSEAGLLNKLSEALDLSTDKALNMVMRTGLHPLSGRELNGHQVGETGIFNTLVEILKPEILRLVEEIDRIFMYAAAQARGGGQASICLLGSLARWPGFDRVISGFTNLPLSTVASPLRLFGTDEEEGPSHGTTAEPEFAVATGLALRGLTDDA